MKYYPVSWSTKDVIPDPYKWIDTLAPIVIGSIGVVIISLPFIW